MGIFTLAPISNNDTQYPDVDAKEEQRSEEQAWYKGGEAEEFEVVTLAEPESLSRCQNKIASRGGRPYLAEDPERSSGYSQERLADK